jgi:hypothetical protein
MWSHRVGAVNKASAAARLATPGTTPGVFSAEGSRQDDQQMFGGIEFPPVVYASGVDQSDATSPPTAVIDFELNSPAAAMRDATSDRGDNALPRSKAAVGSVHEAQAPSTTQSAPKPAEVALRPSSIAFEADHVGGPSSRCERRCERSPRR